MKEWVCKRCGARTDNPIAVHCSVCSAPRWPSKKQIILFSAFLFIGFVLTLWHFSKPIIHAEGRTYILKSSEGSTKIYGSYFTDKKITVREQGLKSVITFRGATYQVQVLDDQKTESHYFLPVKVIYPDDREMEGRYFPYTNDFQVLDDSRDAYVPVFFYDLERELGSMPELMPSTLANIALDPNPDHAGHPQFSILAIFFIVLCVFDAYYPEVLFKIRYALIVDDPEPTDFYLFVNHIASIIGILASLVLLVWSLEIFM